MRILHTSDWHLGKRLFKLDRSPEHELFLNWLLSILREEKIDVLLIAGDIFDTPTPPHQSLEVFYNFLHRVSTETTTDTYIIAGNHDSGLLLEAPARLLSFHRVKIWGKLSTEIKDHWINITKGKESIDLCALPFFRSYELLPQGEGDALAVLKTYLEPQSKNPSILMLHHLAGVFEAAGSEQVISLSGVDSIPTEVMDRFDYVALGHIHKPQKVGKKSYYSGSPIPMRFSETQRKSVMIIDVKDSEFEIKTHQIPVFRDLFIVKADESTYLAKLKELIPSTELKGMVEVQLNLAAPRIGLIDEIKEVLDKKGLELLSFLPFYAAKDDAPKKHEKLFELSPLELFQEFYATKFPEEKEVPEDLKADFTELLEKVKHAPHSS
ncbi:exonuclease SbcCD subunit D [Peredibacter starrii]|uniref:Nuclease SbcCD subunit D n=1 Tax=Peredibacter starrii TaxID=28202 RepID=A0AAX4HK97_9BACT|nr:exonuclease SbcCD subunit D C-terminal domain-containing protein [Peredibacter starrii]WPU63656.1 exonuclease SbcCD subunit D C-terminal domain-containing protein [Peredibacter starrii]